MTVAIGMICEDGIVLAADSMFRAMESVVYGDKISPNIDRSWLKFAVAGAGHANYIRAAKEKIDASFLLNPVPLEGVQSIIEATNKNFYEQHAMAHPNPEFAPYWGLLIALSHEKDGFLLLHSTETATTRIDDIYLEGSGGVVAEPYKALWRKDMPAFEAELAAIFMVKYAKIYDAQNCGGDTKVFALYAHRLFQLDAGYIRLAESYFERFLKSSLELLLPLDTDADSEETFFTGSVRGVNDDLRRQRIDLRKYREKALQVVS